MSQNLVAERMCNLGVKIIRTSFDERLTILNIFDDIKSIIQLIMMDVLKFDSSQTALERYILHYIIILRLILQ